MPRYVDIGDFATGAREPCHEAGELPLSFISMSSHFVRSLRSLCSYGNLPIRTARKSGNSPIKVSRGKYLLDCNTFAWW